MDAPAPYTRLLFKEMIKKSVLISALVFGFINLSLAQEEGPMEIQELDEVVVSDSRFSLKRENSGKTVIQISQKELAQNQGKTVAEIINTKSGIEINGSRGREGEVLGVFPRGGRGRQVLILIDGVRVSDPSSFSQEYDLRLLNTAAIESIEIIKGAASTLYGMSAATAVINITTKKASKNRIGANFQSSIGTNQSSKDQNYNIAEFKNAALLSGTLERFTYQLGFSNAYSNGLSSLITPENEEDPFSRYNLDAKIGYEFSQRFKIVIYANQTKINTAYDESFGMVDAPYVFLSEQTRAGLSSKWSYKKGDLNLNAAYSSYFSENQSAFPSVFEGSNYVVDLFNRYTFSDQFLTVLGLNYNLDRTFIEDTKEFSVIDPYVNLVYLSSFGLNINAGARLNLHSEYGSNWVYNLNPSYTYKLSSGYLKFMATYATSYITPSLSQLFGIFGANEMLEPEDDRTIEGGVEYRASSALRVSALYFNRKENNFVFYDNTQFQYFNAAESIEVQGFEVELQWRPIENLSIDANYTYTERIGDNAIRLPRNKINAVAGYSFSKNTFASFSYAYTGQRVDTNFNNFEDQDLDPFSLFGFYIEQEVIEQRLKIFLNADNLFNTEFTEVIGFTTRGRNFRLGLNLIF